MSFRIDMTLFLLITFWPITAHIDKTEPNKYSSTRSNSHKITASLLNKFYKKEGGSEFWNDTKNVAIAIRVRVKE